ncbi:hypothetical protein LI90_2994 [Carbonactinospora thermoautotrophica]|uniref:Uncharacterized protein n=1 Tax=Carbonactinospora thermoautotrophica TaxID=1469144 RepID=A0A132MVS3_9ACTN|nr:hypothetical protein LI90_2994 [Carbonactinospora thermoautotrophica]
MSSLASCRGFTYAHMVARLARFLSFNQWEGRERSTISPNEV